MSGEAIGAIFWIGFSILVGFGPMLVSWIGGNWHQGKVVGDLLAREKSIEKDPLTNLRSVIGDRQIAASGLIFSNVVSAPSWWQLFLARIKTVFGGNIQSLDKMLDWGRSEAMQRLRELAVKNGFDEVINVRMETSTISVDKGGKHRGGSVEIVADGTGIKFA